MKKFIAISLLLALTYKIQAQNQANNWLFGRVSMTFSSGFPVPIGNTPVPFVRSTSISDTNGNLLFSTNGGYIWNKHNQIMQNCQGLFSDEYAKQPIVIVPKPGSTDYYYVFTVGGYAVLKGLQYSIVKMSDNNGDGAVIENNKPIASANWARQKVTAVKHKNNEDWWIITKLYHPPDPQVYACYLLTKDGILDEPKISPAMDLSVNYVNAGDLKVSQNKKIIVSVAKIDNSPSAGKLDICDFNAETGQITHKFFIKEFYNQVNWFGITGMEISPDSKLLYVTFHDGAQTIDMGNYLYQYDLTKTDSLEFLNSHIQIGSLNYTDNLQLGPDGKIYASVNNLNQNDNHYLDVINNVWARGDACNYIRNQVELGTIQNSYTNLPFFPSEYLHRFDFEGRCSNNTFTFRHHFIPEPVSIYWDFGDGNTSTEFNPTHLFQSGGNYEVYAHVVYPDGRIEETSREVEVLAAPEPWLGNDIQMCLSDTLELNAGPGFVQYNWNGQILPPGGQYYTVTDTGYYSVRVKNNLNCYGYDTIHVALYPKVYIDASGVDISPTTCNNSTGAIRGIKVSPAATLEWRNSSGEFIGSTIDIENLPVGSYILTVTDTTGCVTVLPAITVNPADVNVIIQEAPPGPALCGQDNGTITVKTSIFSDLLLFSKDDGSTWEDNLGTFSDLPAGNYWIMVKDALGCEIRYDKNPVKVEALGGPMVTFSGSTEASGSNPDGKITVIATGDSLSYMLNNVVQDTGYFTGLLSGDYVVQITDKYGCSIIVNVTVGELSGLSLSAITEGERKCIKQIVKSPVIVSNLKGVKDFRATILYNEQKITCTNLIEKALTDMTDTLYPGRVVLEWHGSEALDITDTLVIGKLLFETVQSGTADLRWETDTASTIFTDANGKKITANLKVNSDIEVSNPPTVMTSGDIRQCENSMAMISSFCFGGTEPFTYEWTKPDNEIKTESSIIVYLKPSTQGDYIIKVTDAYNCMVKDTLRVEVIQNPTAGFSSDTIPFVGEFRLQATPGFANYEWNTGETTDFINVTEAGKYYVIITNEDCTDTTFVVMKKLLTIDLKVPTAFSPNGDGLNDIFRPVMNTDLVKQYQFVVSNQWGQKIFESYDPLSGWTGNNAPAGVYSWIIIISDINGNVNKEVGSVVLLK